MKDPWFNMATGDGLYHYYGSWLDDPSIPYASLVGYVGALKAGEEIERPTEELARERDRLAEEYGALLDEETRKGFDELLGLSRMVFPYVEEHKFVCDYWFLTRWWNKVREFGALLARHGFLEDSEDVFQLSRHEIASALDELVLTWATGGEPLGPKHWPPIAARRKELLERLGEWTPPPALGVAPEAVADPVLIMLWGITTERVREWARSEEGGRELNGAAASPGVIEGVARVVKTVSEISDVRKGDVLVCRITSPAWAPIFSKVEAVVTDIGGVMSHAAIVCREYGLPAVVGTGRATSQIRTGQTDPRRRNGGRRDDPRVTRLAVRLDDVRGFVFDVDGTLVHRAGDEVRVAPGAREILEAIRSSGRPFALFTNGSHVSPEAFARELREAGLPVEDEQMLTPLRSVQTYLERFRRDASVLPLLTSPAREYLQAAGMRLVDGDDPETHGAVFVAHVDQVDFDLLERAARAVIAGARLLTGSYVAGYAGANGVILSRGAMVTAAIAKASGVRPTVVGKPSRAAVREIRKRLGVPTEEIAVIGDDLYLDVALGHLGGSRTVLVRSAVSASTDLSRVPERRRPHATVDGVAELLDWL